MHSSCTFSMQLLLVPLSLLSVVSCSWPCNGPDYIDLPAADKMAKMWENCEEDQNSAPWLGMTEIAEIMFEDMCPTFNTDGDEMPTSWTGNTRQKCVDYLYPDTPVPARYQVHPHCRHSR